MNRSRRCLLPILLALAVVLLLPCALASGSSAAAQPATGARGVTPPVPALGRGPSAPDPVISCGDVTQIPLAECEALVALYHDTNGPGWTDRDGWLITLSPCSWHGVACSGGHVTRLYLSNNQLSGALPGQLGNLSNLEWLYLFDNQLSGALPWQLGNLSNLQRLDLLGNQLSGAIPWQLGNLSNLESLYLASNQLGGAIPKQLGSLGSLQELHLHNNQLSGAIPAQLGSLSSLRSLALSANRLSGVIPAELCNPPYYAPGYLHLGYNALTSGPACIAADDPDWAQTQTVPPTNLWAALAPPTTIQLSWTPILYTGNGGYYEIFYATAPGGSLARHGATANKSATGYNAGNLTPGVTYYFKVRTYTPAHLNNQSALTSAWSAEARPVTIPGSRWRLYLPLIRKVGG